MKRAAFAAVLFLLTAATAAVLDARQGNSAAAASAKAKIEIIKKANADSKRTISQRLEVFEPELEAHVMTTMKKDIPVQLESIRVHLSPGIVAADARITFPPGSTGNFVVDALVAGTHVFNLKGKLSGTKGQGKFELLDVYIDGIPVPNFVIDALIKRYVKPKYPEVDLKQPFDLPWGIDAIDIGQSRATITY